VNINVCVFVVVFVAMLVQSAFGFGAGLIGISLLALLIPVEVAAPLVVLLSITTSSIIVLQDWRDVHVRSVGWLLISSLFGVPLGVWLLIHGDPHLLNAGLGVFLIAFSAYCLTGGARLELKSDSRLWLAVCGFVSGIFGSAYGMNGPPLLIYGAMRRWSAQRFRATFQGFFLPASIFNLAGYWIAGVWVWAVTYYYLISLPAALAAVLLGGKLNRRLKHSGFHRYLYLALIAIGAMLLIQAAGKRD
jgi:hypothetical protein